MYYHSQGLLIGNTVVTTKIANRGLEEALGDLGIRTVYTNKGDKNLEAAMWGGDYLLGGEVGGNIIINDGHHTAADAVYAALVLGGAVGNMVDRILRSGQVVDFIEVGISPTLRWPAFNVADIAVTLGVALLVVEFLWDARRRTNTACG